MSGLRLSPSKTLVSSFTGFAIKTLVPTDIV